MIKRLALPAAGGALAFVAWTGPEWAGLATLLPLLWIASSDRKTAALTVFAYYLVGARSTPDSAWAFFQNEHSFILGIGLWIAAAALQATPWIVAWKASPSPGQLALRLLLVIAALTIPPLGWIGWLNPWLAASSVFPSMGWGAIAAGLLLLLTFPLLWLGHHRAIVISAALVLASVQIFLPAPVATAPHAWVGMETHWGGPPKPATLGELQRWKQIALETETQFNAGAAVVVFPEQIAGVSGARAEVFLAAYLKPQLAAGKSLVFGSTVYEQSRPFNVASILSADEKNRYLARQSVPFAMWKPWNAESFDTAWLGRNAFNIGGQKVAFSVCFEDFLFGLGLLSFLHERPDVIVSIANAWWAVGNGEIDVQHLHVKLLARIFDVPLIRAINRPKA